jgi:hypothetical protein
MDMKRFKMLILGVLIGSFLVAGVTQASQWMTFEVYLEKITYMLNGKEVQPSDRANQYYNGKEYVPAGLIYKGTTYVPLRFMGESTGNKVAWNGEKKTISVTTPSGTHSGHPLAVQQWIERSLKVEAGQRMTLDGRTYLLVTRGTKPTGGYDVQLKSIQEKDSELVVTVDYIDPAPGTAVTEAITYPYALVSIPATDINIRFEEADGNHIPQLVGVTALSPSVAESDSIKIFQMKQDKNSTFVRGIARVFEGTVNYELLSSSGKVISNGYIQALAAGPDWGTFDVEIKHELLSNGENNLRFYEESMKDGSKLHVVEMTLSK